MPSLKNIKAFFTKPVDVLFPIDVRAARLLAKCDAALVRILPNKVTALLVRVMSLLTAIFALSGIPKRLIDDDDMDSRVGSDYINPETGLTVDEGDFGVGGDR